MMYGQFNNPVFKSLGQKFLNFSKIIVEQDADILRKIYPNIPQKIKLNNEVGMDWVRRNFESWPEVVPISS
jgi:lysyl-tRNA synthetase class I